MLFAWVDRVFLPFFFSVTNTHALYTGFVKIIAFCRSAKSSAPSKSATTVPRTFRRARVSGNYGPVFVGTRGRPHSGLRRRIWLTFPVIEPTWRAVVTRPWTRMRLSGGTSERGIIFVGRFWPYCLVFLSKYVPYKVSVNEIL